MQTLKDRDPQEFAGLVGLYEMAIQQVNNPAVGAGGKG